MSVAIHMVCMECREETCIGQLAADDVTGQSYANIYSGPQYGDHDDATDKFGRFVMRHFGHRLQVLRDEIVFDGMYAEFED